MISIRDRYVSAPIRKEKFLQYGNKSHLPWTHQQIFFSNDASLVDELIIKKPRSLAVKVFCPLCVPPLQSKSKGQDLFDQIMYHIDLVESDYFGMQFMDTEHVSVRKQAASKLLRPMPVSHLDHVTSYLLFCFHKKKKKSLSLAALVGHGQAHKETDPR